MEEEEKTELEICVSFLAKSLLILLLFLDLQG